MRVVVKGTSPHEDKIITIFEKQEDGKYKCYNIEDKYFTINEEQKKEYRTKPRTTPYLFIKKNEKDKKLKTMSLKQQCESINETAKLLLELTNGKINLYRTGSTAKTALQLFYDLCEPPTPEEIETYEIDILEKSSTGACIWGQKGYKNIGYKYDFVSEYPSIMDSSQHKFPIGKGEQKTFTKKEFKNLEFLSFGLYHVKVHCDDRRVFRENYDNWYTHTELNYAKSKLNYKIELITDDEPNALLWDKSKLITGKALFGKFVTYLFRLKYKGHTEVKCFLNALWGTLCQTDMMKIIPTEIRCDQQILSITPCDNGKYIYETARLDKFYENNFARIKPFILSYGRVKIQNVILQNIDKVVRCHTDGIICSSPITNIKLGSDLGMLKYEGKGNCEIINNNNFIFIFIDDDI